MKVLVISPGKAHDPAFADAIAEYQKRLGKRLAVAWLIPASGTKESEAAAILAPLKPDDAVVLLDERGKELATAHFAKLLAGHLQTGTKRLVFIIGGAYGVAGAVRERADIVLKLSALTYPHMLVRLILVEQLYRAVSIIDGGKYHHG